jgi:predicted amidohydrolase YtcJ
MGALTGGADVVIDADGGALLPGLHDHHVHLMALAAWRESVDVTASELDAALRGAPGDGWIRAVGYHEAVHGPLDRDRLDALVPDRPARVQHRSGQAWVLNTLALQRTGIESLTEEGIEREPDGRSTGRLFRMDDVLRSRVGAGTPDVRSAADELAGYGVTAVTDMTPSIDVEELHALAAAASHPGFPLALAVTGGAAVANADVPAARGPVKVVLDDARLPTLDDLTAAFRQARRAGRTIAVHCVTRAELVLALAAWEAVGTVTGDRVEHGAVIPIELVPELRARGLVVVTQPSLLAGRGDQYVAGVDPDDLDGLWRCGSLLAAGVGVAGSSDAPYGDADPWRGIAAAVDRRTPSGAVLGTDERIPARQALDLWLTPLDDPAGRPRRIEVGAPAELCLLAEPLDVALADPAAVTVRATLRP